MGFLCGSEIWRFFKKIPIFSPSQNFAHQDNTPRIISLIICDFITQGYETSMEFHQISVRSPIPSGGLELKLKLTFHGIGGLVDKMKVLIRQSYSWD